MFEEFLKKYIKDLIDCGNREYNVTDENIDDIASMIENNEYIWEIIDTAIQSLILVITKKYINV